MRTVKAYIVVAIFLFSSVILHQASSSEIALKIVTSNMSITQKDILSRLKEVLGDKHLIIVKTSSSHSARNIYTLYSQEPQVIQQVYSLLNMGPFIDSLFAQTRVFLVRDNPEILTVAIEKERDKIVKVKNREFFSETNPVPPTLFKQLEQYGEIKDIQKVQQRFRIPSTDYYEIHFEQAQSAINAYSHAQRKLRIDTSEGFTLIEGDEKHNPYLFKTKNVFIGLEDSQDLFETLSDHETEKFQVYAEIFPYHHLSDLIQNFSQTFQMRPLFMPIEEQRSADHLTAFGEIKNGLLKSGEEYEIFGIKEGNPITITGRLSSFDHPRRSRFRYQVPAGQQVTTHFGQLDGSQLDQVFGIAQPGSAEFTYSLTLRLFNLPATSENPQNILNEEMAVQIHYFNTRSPAKIQFLSDREQLNAGEDATIQVFLEDPIVGQIGQRLLLKTNDQRTIAEGIIIGVDSSTY